MIRWNCKVHNSVSFLFFFFHNQAWSSGRDKLIRLYVKILILQDRFWVVHIQFIRMIKLPFLSQFLVNHIAHLFGRCLILFLYHFAPFAYYVIDRFVSIITKPTSAVSLGLIYFCFDMISPYGVVLFIYQNRIGFSLEVSFS